MPERGLFQSLANGFQKVDVFFAGIAALRGRIIVRGLERDVTVRCPVPSQSLAARLRTAGAVGKHNDGVRTWLMGIKNADVEHFVALGVVQNNVRHLRNRVRAVG